MARVQPTARDVAWVGFAVVVVATTIARAWATAHGLLDADHWLDGAAAAVAIALMALGGTWLALGAWRRTARSDRSPRHEQGSGA